MVKDVEVDSNGSDCKDKMVKRLLFKNLNKDVGYLIIKARLAFT